MMMMDDIDDICFVSVMHHGIDIINACVIQTNLVAPMTFAT
jgi:hypothetical protein